MIFVIRSTNPNANSRVNFSAISFGGAMVALRRPCIFRRNFYSAIQWYGDVAAKAQGELRFSLVGAADTAVAKWSNATVSARIYRVLSAMDDAAALYNAVQR